MSLMVSVSGVRGIVGESLNPEVIGRWVRALAAILPPGSIVLGRDSRTTGEALAAAATSYLLASGRDVHDVGLVPTPTVQLAVEHWNAAGGIILSASHNPGQWNALKFVDHGGSFLSPERFEALRAEHDRARWSWTTAAGYGALRVRHDEALDAHLGAVIRGLEVERIRGAGLRVALECGHGAGGTLLPRVADALGVDLRLLHAEPNGQLLPNPEPTHETLSQICTTLGGGFAFLAMTDPDADRCGFAIPGTDVIGEEWTLPLVVAHRLTQARGPVVTNLSSSTRLDVAAQRHGVPLVRTPVGEAHVVAGMRAHDALIGGEGNGGVIDPRVHLGRDAAVALALLCEAEATQPGGLQALASGFPPRIMVKEKVPVSENGGKGWQAALEATLGPAEDERDGLRWVYPDGFLHVRASNTEPIVRIVSEAAEESDARDRIGRAQEALTTS